MKKIIVLIYLISTAFISGQEKKLNKNKKVFYRVDGICEMCKTRIETAALKTKGVKFALWNIETKQLNLIIDKRKTNVNITQENILKVGHDILLEDNTVLKAKDESYNSVYPCCKYRDEVIIENYKGEFKNYKKKILK